MGTENRIPSITQLQAETLIKLNEECARIGTILVRDNVLQSIAELLTDQLGFNAAWLGELCDDQGTLVIRHISGNLTNQFHGLAFRKGCGLGGKVFALGSIQWVDDYLSSRTITHDYDDQVTREGIQRIIGAPIAWEGQPMAVLLGGSRDTGSYGDHAAAVLETVASRTAAALVAAERSRQAAELAANEERRTMALELHDNIGAMLFAITAKARSVGQNINVDAALRERVLEIERQASEAAVALRESLRTLRTPPKQMALGVALEEACRGCGERGRITAQLVVLDVLQPLKDSSAHALLAAAREGLRNVEKHARATRVIVTVASTRGGVAVTVTDDGVGLSRASSEGNGFGIEAISDVLRGVDGDLQVGDNGDGGVCFRAWVPY